MESITEYLKEIKELMPGKQAEFYQWILKNGILFKGSERDKEMEQYLMKLKFPHLKKQCFYNSQMILDYSLEFKYCEGYFIPEKLFPVEHGFVVYKNKIIDITTNSKGEITEYFGVHIPTSFVQKLMVKTRTSESRIVEYWDSLMVNK